jgi:hypothetical protein
MIDNENKQELKLISDIILSGTLQPEADASFEFNIIFDAIYDAINTSGDVDDAIKYIMITHPILLENLKEVIKENYPDKLSDVEKLAVLT